MNTFTEGDQDAPAVASDAAGRFVVVWSGANGTVRSGVFGQRFDRDGAALGDEFTIAADQGQPAVASDAAGNFVVAWDNAEDGNDTGVFARRYDHTGAALGAAARVNTATEGFQADPAVACSDTNQCVVVWNTISGGVFGQRFDAGGNPQGGEFTIDTQSSVQHFPEVVRTSDGFFLVVWNRFDSNPATSRFAGHLYSPTGDQIGAGFVITTGNEFGIDPASLGVTAFGSSSFVVAWNSPEHGDPSFPTRPIPPDVYAQRFETAGDNGAQPVGDRIAVTAEPTRRQHHAAIASLPGGAFVVVWQNDSSGGTGSDRVDNIVGQQFAGDGQPFGPSFLVNDSLDRDHRQPAIAADRAGNFVVVWYASDENGRGVFARRFTSATISATATPTVTRPPTPPPHPTPRPTVTPTPRPPTSTPSPTSTAPPPPTNTATAVATDTPTGGANGGDGCSANPQGSSALSGIASIAPLLAIRRRRRRRLSIDVRRSSSTTAIVTSLHRRRR